MWSRSSHRSVSLSADLPAWRRLRSPTLLPVTPHPCSTTNVVHLVSVRDLPVTSGLSSTARLMSLAETLRQGH